MLDLLLALFRSTPTAPKIGPLPLKLPRSIADERLSPSSKVCKQEVAKAR